MTKNSCLTTSSILLLSLLISLTHTSCAGESYEDCILKNVKGVTDKQALSMIRNACREKTAAPIPKKCRDIKEDYFGFLGGGSIGPSELEKCIAECLESGWWERTFGSCRTYF